MVSEQITRVIQFFFTGTTKLNLVEVSEFAGSQIKACERGLPLGDDPSRLPPTYEARNLVVGHGEVGRPVVEAKLRAVLHRRPDFKVHQYPPPQKNGNQLIGHQQRVNFVEHLRCDMRPPAPRPESKSVTATPRAARSDALTAPVTAVGGKEEQPDRTRQFERGVVQECGDGRDAYFRHR